MTKLVLIGPLVLISLLIMRSEPTVAKQEQRAFEGLIAAADAVVAVEIISTDYSATPSDGPMLASAKVLKIVKGPLTTGKTFNFTETAWVGPSYQKGEYRILFLEKIKPAEYRKTTEWRILSNLYARTDFFVRKDSLSALSTESLKSFLRKLEELTPRPKKATFDSP